MASGHHLALADDFGSVQPQVDATAVRAAALTTVEHAQRGGWLPEAPAVLGMLGLLEGSS